MPPNKLLCLLASWLCATCLAAQPMPVMVTGITVAAPTVDTPAVDGYVVELETVPEGCSFSGGGPLPVTAPALAARRLGPKSVLLSWSLILAEENTWWLERRLADEADFTDLYRLTPTEILTREWADANGFVGLSYYRLRGEGPDGEVGYSKIRQVGNDADARLWLSPNPTDGRVQVRFPQAEAFQFSVIDGRGRGVLSGGVRSEGWVDLSGLPAGAYVLRLTGSEAGQVVVRRVVLR